MVDIEVLVDCFNNMIDGLYYYYDKRTNEIIEINIKHLELAYRYMEGKSLELYSDWERNVILDTVEFVRDIRNYVKLPDKYDVDEYRIMARFCYTRKRKRQVNKLMDALSSKGRLRAFNETVRSLKLEKEWIEFKRKVLLNVAIKWCKENGIEY